MEKVLYCTKFCSAGKKCISNHGDCCALIDKTQCPWADSKIDQLELFLIIGGRGTLKVVNPEEEDLKQALKKAKGLSWTECWEKYGKQDSLKEEDPEEEEED